MKGKSSLKGFRINQYFKKKSLYLGNRIEGWLFLGNNQFDQEFQQIISQLTLFYSIQDQSYQYPLQKWKFSPIQLPAFGQKIYPFACNLPKEMMVSGNRIFYEFSTEVITVENVRKTKQVRIPILPPEPIVNLFQAWKKLDFQFDSTWIEDQVQIFRFTSKQSDKIRACDVSIFFKEKGIHLFLTIHRMEKSIQQLWSIPDSWLGDVKRLYSFIDESLAKAVQKPISSSQIQEKIMAIGSGVFQTQNLQGDEILEESSLWEMDDLFSDIFDEDIDED